MHGMDCHHQSRLSQKGALEDKEMVELLQNMENAFLQFHFATGQCAEAGQTKERILLERLKPNSRGVST
jgi:hypothetical protein